MFLCVVRQSARIGSVHDGEAGAGDEMDLVMGGKLGDLVECVAVVIVLHEFGLLGIGDQVGGYLPSHLVSVIVRSIPAFHLRAMTEALVSRQGCCFSKSVSEFKHTC